MRRRGGTGSIFWRIKFPSTSRRWSVGVLHQTGDSADMLRCCVVLPFNWDDALRAAKLD